MSDTTITLEERAELRELAEKATPGEWTGQGNPCGFGWVRIPCKNMLGLYHQALLGQYKGADDDARYIAAACNLTPRLLTALEAAEASKAEAEADNARLRAVAKFFSDQRNGCSECPLAKAKSCPDEGESCATVLLRWANGDKAARRAVAGEGEGRE